MRLRAEHMNYKENNPLIPVAKLILGILSIIATILWLVQLGLYVFPKQFTGEALYPFLNTLFIELNEFFPILASALVGSSLRPSCVASRVCFIFHVLHDQRCIQFRPAHVYDECSRDGASRHFDYLPRVQWRVCCLECC